MGVEKQSVRIVPAEGDACTGVVLEHVLVVTAFVDERGHAEVRAAGLGEVDALVAVVAVTVVEQADPEPVAAGEGPVAALVAVVAMDVDERAEATGVAVAVAAITAAAHACTLRAVRGDLVFAVVVGASGDGGIGLSGVLVGAAPVGEDAHAADTSEALAFAEQVVAVVPDAFEEQTAAEKARTLTAALEFPVVVSREIRGETDAELSVALRATGGLVAIVTGEVD